MTGHRQGSIHRAEVREARESEIKLHSTTLALDTASGYLPYVLPIIESLPCSSVIAYGCGQAALASAIATTTGVNTYCFNPYIEEFSLRPGHRFDLLLNIDFLAHVPEDELDAVFQDMKSLSDRCFFVISLRYADDVLSNGLNTHRTVKPEEWWAERVFEHFGSVSKILSTDPSTCCLTTWEVSDVVRRRIRNPKRTGKLHKEFQRFKGRIERGIADFKRGVKIRVPGRFATESTIMAELAGKTVSMVGNARSLLTTSHGTKIDANDLVIRCNRAPIASFRSCGTRTDWIATAVPLGLGFAASRGARRVLWLNADRTSLSPAMLADRDMYVQPIAEYRRLKRQVGRNASTGFIMLDLLARSKCKSVEIFGFDFFKSQSLSGHDLAVWHDFGEEKRLVSSLLDTDPRFVMVD